MDSECSWDEWLAGVRSRLTSQARWRAIEEFDLDVANGTADRTGLVSFASNDYLGLATDPEVREAASKAAMDWGSGSGASRLVGGTRSIHSELESDLADWKSTERAILFPTGYAANIGVLTALAGQGTAIFSDELNHASIIDGARLAKGAVSVFPHRDYETLAKMLDESSSRRKIIVSDACFSMDGDFAELDRVFDLGRQNDALVIIDEAHSVLGPSIPEELGGSPWLIRVGTLSKMLGASGGFVACSGPVADSLVNLSRPYIFTTAPPPPSVGASIKALRIIRSARGAELIGKLKDNVAAIDPQSVSPIIPIVLGEDSAALEASRSLREHGYFVPAIRPPTVAEGSARLRISVSAAHTREQVSELSSLIGELGIAR